MAFVSFFGTPEVTKTVLPKVLQSFKAPYCICCHRELNQKQKSFFSFPRNIQCPERLMDTLPFSFLALWDFFREKSPSKGHTLQFFWSFGTKWMLKNPRGSSFSGFLTLWGFFQKQFLPQIRPFNSFDDLRQNGLQSIPRGAPIQSNFGVYRVFRREYFDTLKHFCYFWAWDLAPTWAVPGLLWYA